MTNPNEWCTKHLAWGCVECWPEPVEPNPFASFPSAEIYDAPTEKTIVGVPPAPPIEPPEETGAVPASEWLDPAALEFEYEPTVPIELPEQTAAEMDANVAPLDPVFDAQQRTLGAVFEAMLAAGIPAGVCNEILFQAVEKLGLKPANES